ncbi:LOW QUALITY PROTEIN: hypothetical protein MKX08_004136 [Trichoderma sp. CBMAI-0020]|nr:LOW QUALITY PROTEIN: hypothetical protein MKX08_004136 [Trichoderma sp. CBMAI-0020]
MVMDLLRIIAVSLRHFLSTIQNRKDNPKAGSDHTNNIKIELGQMQEYIDGAIDRLHRLGVTIRHASTASLAARVEDFTAKRPGPSLEETSFLMVRFLYPTAPLSLQRLLGRSVLERYFNLKYREEHRRLLATRRSSGMGEVEEDQPDVLHGEMELLSPINQKDYVADGVKIDELVDQVVESGARPLILGSKPSILQIDDIQHQNRRTTLSATSRTSTVRMAEIDYPKPPKPSGDGELGWAICYLCSESIPHDKLRDTRWWRRHVDSDLRPYVCLYDSCSASPNAFDRFTPWLNHMEEHHSINWIKTINYKTIWRCDIEHKPPEQFDDEAMLRDYMQKHHIELFTESQLAAIARRSSVRIPGSQDTCPLCGFDASEAPLITDQSSDLQPPQKKRKREVQHAPRANLNVNVQAKRTKVHFQNRAETSTYGPSRESDLEPTRGPDIDSISPQIKARLQRERLSRHIATHLKALSFMSLRLKAFQEQSKEEDQCSTTGDQEDTNEGDGPRGFDTELEAQSLNRQTRLPTDQILKDLDVSRPVASPIAFGVQECNVVDRNTLNDDSTIPESSSPAEPGFDLLRTQPQWEKLFSLDEVMHLSQTQKGNTAWKKSEIRDQV